jgi:hypothetical protein
MSIMNASLYRSSWGIRLLGGALLSMKLALMLVVMLVAVEPPAPPSLRRHARTHPSWPVM